MSQTHRMQLLPPAADVCQECAWKHAPEEPHNFETFFYKVKFNMEHGRAPTWADALSHVKEPLRSRWEAVLLDYGEVIEGPG